jgi:hypothetical protein
MSHPTQSRPTVAAARKAVADEVIREAVALYEQAKRAVMRFEGAWGGDGALGGLGDLLAGRLAEAESHLVGSILAAESVPGWARPAGHPGPSRGVRCDGRLYLVTSDGSDADVFTTEPVGDKRREAVAVLSLHVVDEAGLADAGTTAGLDVYRPDGARVEYVTG